MAAVKGYCCPRFEKVKRLFEENLASGEDVGASITLIIDGDYAIDIWGGYVDEAKTEEWKEDTIVNVWSTTKLISTFAILLLHSRGLLDIDENVAKYWPEFSTNGKESVKVKHIISHTCGLPGWQEKMGLEDVYDLKKSTALLAAQAPWWDPGTKAGYHGVTLGHLCGELVRRLTGKSLTRFVAEEIAAPMKADFQIGVKEMDMDRVSPIIPCPPLGFDYDNMDTQSFVRKTFGNPRIPAKEANSSAFRLAELGAINGHGNSRSVARILSAVSHGGMVDDVQYLSLETIEMIFQEQYDGVDAVLGAPIRNGIGFPIAGGGTELSFPGIPKGQHRRVAYWEGWGGSFGIMDVDRRATSAYTMNRMGDGTSGSRRKIQYQTAIYEVLDSSDFS